MCLVLVCFKYLYCYAKTMRKLQKGDSTWNVNECLVPTYLHLRFAYLLFFFQGFEESMRAISNESSPVEFNILVSHNNHMFAYHVKC